MAEGFNNRPSINQQLTDNILTNISGVFSTKPIAKYMSGARTILRVNDVICGFAFGVSWRINTEHIPINTIDDYFAYEYAPQRITVDGTISALHIPGQSPGVELWQSDALSFVNHRYITIEVKDVATDNLLFYTSKAVITTRVEDIKVDQLANVSLNFKAIGYRDERSPKLAEQEGQSSGGTLAGVRNLINKIPF
jgi:hypothetical protein